MLNKQKQNKLVIGYCYTYCPLWPVTVVFFTRSFVRECFVFMLASAPHACLVPVVVDHSVGASGGGCELLCGCWELRLAADGKVGCVDLTLWAPGRLDGVVLYLRLANILKY